MESLAADFAALATSSPSLVESCDEDTLRLILWKVSGERGKPTVIEPSTACALMRLAPLCRGFAQIVRSFVPEDKQAELKQTCMHLELHNSFNACEELPWTAETVLHVSTMDVARYLAEETTEVLRAGDAVPAWLGTRVGRLLLSGGIDKLRERIKRAPSKKGRVQFEEITAAYTLLIETKREAGLLFDAEKVLRQHSLCGRGMCGQLLRTLMNSRTTLHMCGNLIAREKDQLSRVRALEVDEFGASEASVEHALLDELLRKALLRATDGGFFSGMLHVLKLKVGSSRTRTRTARGARRSARSTRSSPSASTRRRARAGSRSRATRRRWPRRRRASSGRPRTRRRSP